MIFFFIKVLFSDLLIFFNFLVHFYNEWKSWKNCTRRTNESFHMFVASKSNWTNSYDDVFKKFMVVFGNRRQKHVASFVAQWTNQSNWFFFYPVNYIFGSLFLCILLDVPDRKIFFRFFISRWFIYSNFDSIFMPKLQRVSQWMSKRLPKRCILFEGNAAI